MSDSTELTADAPEPQESTVIEPEKTPSQPDQTLSRDDAIERAIAEAEQGEEDDAPEDQDEKGKPEEKGEEEGDKSDEKSDEKPEDKPEKKDEKPDPEEKADKKPEVKGENDNAKPEKKGDTRFIEPPKTFMPDAKEVWQNVPHKVRRDIDNMVRQHEDQMQQVRDVLERYEPIREYDELVRQNGRAGVHETLAEVKQLEDLMERNPLAGLNQILMRAGPRKPDGSPVSLYELAQKVVEAGQDNYNRAVSQQPQQQQQSDPQVETLQREIAQLKAQQFEATVIAPFKATHPRYDELKSDIAFFLQSDKVPKSLSPADRLEVAYDMAVRVNPASTVEAPPSNADPASDNTRVATSSGGSPSTRGAPPTRGSASGSKARRLSKEEAIEKAMASVLGS
jgi:hypothetical protein